MSNGTLQALKDTAGNRQPVLNVARPRVADDGPRVWCTMAQVLGDGLGHAFVPKQGGFVHALVGLFGKAAMAGAELRHHDLAIRGLVRKDLIAHLPAQHLGILQRAQQTFLRHAPHQRLRRVQGEHG